MWCVVTKVTKTSDFDIDVDTVFFDMCDLETSGSFSMVSYLNGLWASRHISSDGFLIVWFFSFMHTFDVSRVTSLLM